MNITVYLGASNGNDQNLILAARKLGKWIGGECIESKGKSHRCGTTIFH